MTVYRLLYEQGLPGLEGKLNFASYGDLSFEAVLDEFDRHDLPPCMCRLIEEVPDIHAEVVAYAAACLSESGLPQIRLITSWENLKGLRMDETTQPSDTDLTALKQKFHSIVLKEFAPARAVGRLEKDNLRAGRAQLILDFLAIRRLLFPIDSTENDNFWAIVRDHLDPLIAERDQLIIPELPVETLREIGKELIFDVKLPKLGSKTSVTIPILLVSAAVDAGCRIADSMKVKKSGLTTGMVRARIDREIERQLKVFKAVGV